MICILGGSPASAGLDTTCQEKIRLSSLQSLQDQIAELRSSTITTSTAATAPEPLKEKRIAKELSVRYFVLSWLSCTLNHGPLLKIYSLPSIAL